MANNVDQCLLVDMFVDLIVLCHAGHAQSPITEFSILGRAFLGRVGMIAMFLEAKDDLGPVVERTGSSDAE